MKLAEEIVNYYRVNKELNTSEDYDFNVRQVQSRLDEHYGKQIDECLILLNTFKVEIDCYITVSIEGQRNHDKLRSKLEAMKAIK